MVTRQQVIKCFVPVIAAVMCVLLVAGGCTQGAGQVYQVSDSPTKVWGDQDPTGWRGTRVIQDNAEDRSISANWCQWGSGPPGPGAERAVIMSEAAALMSREALQEYHIGPGDILVVRAFQLLELDREAVLTVEVDRHGEIYLPLLNDVKVAGMTAPQIEKDLTYRLGSEFIRDPKVNVSVQRHNSKHVLVHGHVGHPGLVALASDRATLLDVIAEAGGVKPNPAPNIEIIRGGIQTNSGPLGVDSHARRQLVPIVKLYAEGGEQINPVVQPGDLVQVYAGSEGYVYLSGEVTQQGAKAFRRPMNILQAVTVAGGVTNIAQEDKVKLIRLTPEGEERVIMVDLQKIRKGQERNLVLAQNDTIMVPVDPVKKFFDDVASLIKTGVRAGVDVSYDAGEEMGFPGNTGTGYY